MLHDFGKGSDGFGAAAQLIHVGRSFYGTTVDGGVAGHGTVYSVSPDGEVTVLHSFDVADGNEPNGPLFDVDGTLYGTTIYGGESDRYDSGGTVFEITLAGAFHVLHRFATDKPLDGQQPGGGLMSFKGKLYGTTSEGGAYGKGTVFSLTRGSEEHIVYSFGKSARDGISPQAGLIAVDGMLYGTTAGGGAYGLGTVFALTPEGVERVLHSFGKYNAVAYDGATPTSTLIDVDGTLYGTTRYTAGGENSGGTVFTITTDGREHVIASFEPNSACFDLYGGLSSRGSTIYGTGSFPQGCVFSINKAGVLQTIYTFGTSANGVTPQSPPIEFDGVLYGTTSDGGRYYQSGAGAGVFYSLKP